LYHLSLAEHAYSKRFLLRGIRQKSLKKKTRRRRDRIPKARIRARKRNDLTGKSDSRVSPK
jgi:hypothetical protein